MPLGASFYTWHGITEFLFLSYIYSWENVSSENNYWQFGGFLIKDGSATGFEDQVWCLFSFSSWVAFGGVCHNYPHSTPEFFPIALDCFRRKLLLLFHNFLECF